MQQSLRIPRIIVSVVVMLLLTASIVGMGCAVPAFAAWIAKVQIFPAVATFSLLTFVVWLVVTLLFGRIYCSTMCPLGTFQDIMARLMRLTKRQAERRAYRYRRPVNRIRYTVLILVIFLLMVGVMAVAQLLDPYTVYVDMVERCGVTAVELVCGRRILLASITGTVVSILLTLIIAVVSARSGRTLCNTICPVGTTLGFVSRYSLWQIDIDTDLCTHCGNCEKVCKSSCINLADNTVDGSRCVNCFNCLSVCPNAAIRYTINRKQLSDPLMQPLGNADATAGLTDKTTTQ